MLVSAPVVLAAADGAAAGFEPLPLALTSRAIETNAPLREDEIALLSAFVARSVPHACFVI